MSLLDLPLTGHRTRLRLVSEDDAGYIHQLRTDSRYNAHLSAVKGTPETQRAWIRAYKAREAEGSEYYFVIERNDDGRRCGVVRVYDIRDGQFTWGSWILDENKPRKAALDTALLVYRFGFDVLGLSKAVYDVRRENTVTLAFHDRFGSQRVREDGANIHYIVTIDMFRIISARLASAVSG